MALAVHVIASVTRRRQIMRTIPDHATGRFDEMILEPYGLISELARGGMSTVYLGEDRETGERVAIKALDAFYVGRSDLVHRLLGELDLAQRAHHPNLIEIRGAEQTSQGVPYLVMEYLDGESLRALSERRSLPHSMILAIAAQVARAVAALHDAGVVHCDIKPDNVFVLDDSAAGPPRIKVIDYGVARSIGDPALPDSAIAGTPAFMAPEQWRGAPVAASDVYGLGCLLYELVCRRPVFSGSLPQVMTAHCDEPPVFPAELCTDLDPEIDHLIMRMLAKDPEMRPTMREVDAALSALASANVAVRSA